MLNTKFITTLKNNDIANTKEDLNDNRNPGGYYFSNGSFKNMPPYSDGCFLLVFGQSGDRFAQLSLGLNGNVHFRINNGIYSSWMKII